MKKIKTKIILSSLAGLSTAALVGSLCATIAVTNKNNDTNSVVNGNVNAIVYKTITYNTITNVTLQGPIKAKIRSGRVFGSAAKPTATHSLGFKFLGWSKTQGSKADIITNSTAVTIDLSLYPIFEDVSVYTVKSDISTLKIKDTDSATDTNEFKLYKDSTQVTTGVTWSLTCSPAAPTGSTITLDGNKIKYASVPAGSYLLTITGKCTDAAGVEQTASKQVTLVSTSTTLKGYLKGGKTLLTFKKDATGSDTNQWVLYDYSSQTITGATWTIVDKSTSAAITGLTIVDGVVNWANVAVGSYTAVITATKDDATASVEVSVIVEDNVYTLSGGSSLSTAYTGTAGAATNAWSLSKDGTTVTTGITWGVTGTSETTITVEDGKLKWAAATPTGTYSLNITATVNSTQVASVPVSLVLNETTFTVSSAISSLTIDDNDEGTDTNEFTLSRNGTALTTGVTWSVTSSTAPTSGTIAMDGNKIKYSNVAAGSYQLTITGKWTDATSTERFASKIVTLISNSTKAQGIVISGKDTLLTTQSSEYTATVYPTSAVTDLSWSVTGWTGTEATKPEFDTTTANKLITKAGSEGEATIQVSDSKSSISSTFKVQVNHPWTNSDKVWTTSSDGNSFVSLSMDDLASEAAKDTIIAYDIDGTEISGGVTRTSLDSNTLNIGSGITSIPNNFLNDWTTFNGTISFTTDSKLISIGEAFLAKCTSFNQALSLPSNLNIIYNNFMDGCTSFNSALTLPTSLTTIGGDFLYGCTSFNQAVTLSSSVKYVGEAFMTNCDAMVSTLTINVAEPSLVFIVPSDVSYTCATETSTAVCYTTGITVAGTGATEFKQLFADRTSTPYRKLI